MKVEPFGPLDPSLYREIVRRALAEDVRWGDLTTEATVAADRHATGVVTAKTSGVLAGIDVASEAFHQLDPRAEVVCLRHDGETFDVGETVLQVNGLAAALLTAERTALNFLQRLSGIATLTRWFVQAAGGRGQILDTRKTTPTLRVLEKYAVRAGGGVNHRFALDDGLLIKDNHLRMVGSVGTAVAAAKDAGHELPVEIEVASLDDIEEAVTAGADIVMVDNFSTADVREAVVRVAGRAKVEVSGGVTVDRIAELVATGAEFISVGALTHSAPAIDYSFALHPSAGPPDGGDVAGR